MAKTNVSEEVSETKTPTHKEYVVADQLNPAVTYKWSKRISRDTENNNALIKCPPAFLNALQREKPELTNDRKIKQWICKQLNITWDDSFMKFDLKPVEEVKPAVTDKTVKAPSNVMTEKKLIKLFGDKMEKAIKKLGKPLTNAQIENAIDNSKQLGDFHKEMLKKHFLTEKKEKPKEIDFDFA